MIQHQINLFQQITKLDQQIIKQLQQPILQNYFILNKSNIFLTLTENSIYLITQSSLNQNKYQCKLAFDIKFQVIYQSVIGQGSLGIPIAIKIEKQHTSQQILISASNPTIIQTWSLQLEKKINQRNFHKLFKAKKKIGKGAFATVYLAQRLRDHKMVAVKAFSKQKQYSGQKGRQSLENEIKLMRKLNHQNIVKLEGVYQTQNSIYVILQYLQGPQLNQFIKNNNLQKHQIKQIIQYILKALSHLSQYRIIHRDLKPQNIMFKSLKSMDLAIGDFGLATQADSEKYLFVRCGTPGFVAPQIINIKDMTTKSDPVSDVFSAGIIFHHLLFGYSIFEGKKYNQILSQNRQCIFDFSKFIYKSIDSRSLDLLMKMLQKDPTKRLSAEEALKHQFFYQQMDIQQNKQNICINSLVYKKLSDLTEASSQKPTCYRKTINPFTQFQQNHIQ